MAEELMFGFVRNETRDAIISTRTLPDDPKEHWPGSVSYDGIEFDLEEFEDVTGFVPTGEELYDLLGKKQREWARKGDAFVFKIRYAVDNHKSRIGSDREDPLMDHTYRVEKIVGKPKRYKRESR